MPSSYDATMRVAARTIYNTCLLRHGWIPALFDQAERFHPVHHRHAVDAAYQVQIMLVEAGITSCR